MRCVSLENRLILVFSDANKVVNGVKRPSFHCHVISFDSSRPHTAATPDPTNDEHLSAVSPQKLLTQTPVQVKSAIWHAKQQLGGSTEQSEILQLVYHTSDFTVSSIVDNPKVLTLTVFVLPALYFMICKMVICIFSLVFSFRLELHLVVCRLGS